MLSPLQLRVAAIVASLREAEGFALAGGAALIAYGDVDRLTHDLDFFGLSADAVDRLLPVVESALVAEGFSVDRVQVGSGFARLIVSSGEDRTELDLASDARLFPVEMREPAPLLSRVPDHGLKGVSELGAATSAINVFVDDVDAHHARSVAAGVTIVHAPADQPYGQREYSATDLEGHLWSFATPS